MIEFLDELPVVFKILQNNPDAIIDDTAMERLLGWVDYVAKTDNEKMFQKVQSILESECIYTNPVTCAFSIRVVGSIGQYMTEQYMDEGSKTTAHSTIQKIFLKTLHNRLFEESEAVKYAVYVSLNHLACNQIFIPFLNESYWEVMLSTFDKSSHFVKKSAVQFLSTLLMSAIKMSNDDVITNLINFINCSLSNGNCLSYIGKSLCRVLADDFKAGLHILYTTDYLKKVVNGLCKHDIVQHKIELLSSLIPLFKLLKRSDLCEEVAWNQIFEDPKETFFKLLQYSLNDSALRKSFPNLCSSLLITTSYSRHHPAGWNDLLVSMLKKLFIDDQAVVRNIEILGDIVLEEEFSVKEWKIMFILVLSAITDALSNSKIEISKCLHNELFTCLIDCAEISLNCHVNDVIDRYRGLIGEKKVTRILLQYFALHKYLSDEVIRKYSKFLSKALSLIIEPPQITCSILKLLGDFLKDHSQYYLEYPEEESRLALHLKMMLSHENWEVRDSTLNLIQVSFENIYLGSEDVPKQHRLKKEQCKTFFLRNQFWCDLLPLLNHHESFVRSSTILVIAHVRVIVDFWNVFSSYNHLDETSLFQTILKIFLDDQRLDDLFTRRSIVQAFTIILQSNMINLVDQDKISETMTCIFSIVESSFRDFDWEVRKLNQTLLQQIVKLSLRQNISSFILNYLLTHGILSEIIEACLDDPEMLVNVESLNTLEIIGDGIQKIDCIEGVNGSNELREGVNGSNELVGFEIIVDKKQAIDYVRVNPIKTLKDFTMFHSLVDNKKLRVSLKPLDDNATSNPISFIHDVIASTKQSEENLLDCY